jgi:beta-glucosidase
LAKAQEPPRRLAGWQKVELAPDESKNLTIRVEPLYLSIYNADRHGWKLVPSEYRIGAGGGSRRFYR